jgi:hypothetical protein
MRFIIIFFLIYNLALGQTIEKVTGVFYGSDGYAYPQTDVISGDVTGLPDKEGGYPLIMPPCTQNFNEGTYRFIYFFQFTKIEGMYYLKIGLPQPCSPEGTVSIHFKNTTTIIKCKDNDFGFEYNGYIVKYYVVTPTEFDLLTKYKMKHITFQLNGQIALLRNCTPGPFLGKTVDWDFGSCAFEKEHFKLLQKARLNLNFSKIKNSDMTQLLDSVFFSTEILK